MNHWRFSPNCLLINMHLFILIMVCVGLFALVVYAFGQVMEMFGALLADSKISPERLRQLQAEGDALKQSQDALKALDTDPNARVYSYDEIKHRIGLEGLKCKARMGSNKAYHYGQISGGYVDCGYWGVPLQHCSDFVFFN